MLIYSFLDKKIKSCNIKKKYKFAKFTIKKTKQSQIESKVRSATHYHSSASYLNSC